MRIRLIFGVGILAGYLLGIRTGRERYDAVMRGLRRAADRPESQAAAGVVHAQLTSLLHRLPGRDTPPPATRRMPLPSRGRRRPAAQPD